MIYSSLSPRTPSLLLSSIRRSLWPSDVALVKLREGLRLNWYPDSLGKKTGGYGHLYRKGDPKTFTQEVAEQWLEKDITSARNAAMKLFLQLPYQTASLMDVLVSMCFQLGNAWHLEHKKTWGLMLAGDYMRALKEAENSDWFRQTPVRVKDLQWALSEAFLLGRQYDSLGL